MYFWPTIPTFCITCFESLVVSMFVQNKCRHHPCHYLVVSFGVWPISLSITLLCHYSYLCVLMNCSYVGSMAHIYVIHVCTLQKAKNCSRYCFTLSKLHRHDSWPICHPDIPKTSQLAIFLRHQSSGCTYLRILTLSQHLISAVLFHEFLCYDHLALLLLLYRDFLGNWLLG